MDVLSDVLLSVRLTGAVFFAIDAVPPFVTESPSVATIGHYRLLPGAAHIFAFHVVTEGSCWAGTVENADPPVHLRAGDIVVYPGGDANAMSSEPGMRGRPDPALYVRPPDRALPFPLRMGLESTGPRTRFVCGFVGCDTRLFDPLMDALPRVVHSRVSPESREWVSNLAQAAAQASGGPGSAGREAMLAKLAEVMFVEALRSYLADLGADEHGWLAGVRDPQVGAALRLIHGRPAHAWTLERLARAVGMSRSSFASRFTTFMGIPPMRYLALWRLHLAARMLESGTANVSQAASAVGYQSEAAFNRAFKRQLGQAPGLWRQARPQRMS